MSDYRTLLADAMLVNSQVLTAALAKLQITKVVVTYEGREGSGGIAELIVQPTEQAALLDHESLAYRCVVGEFEGSVYEYESVDRSFSLNQALRDFTLTWAEFHHANWEVDEGSEGKVTIHTAHHHCQLCHTAFFLQHTDYCYEL